jgi:hypothetical protein
VSRLAVLLALVALVGCAGGSEAQPAAPSPAERDVRALVARMLELHPGLAPGTEARAALQQRGEALASRVGSLTREQLVAEVMRLTTLGERNGHTGVFVFHPHARPLHVYPVRLYAFPDGMWVVDAADPALVGKRVESIDGVPVPRLAEAGRALVPHDNDTGVDLILPEVLVTEEALKGLGLTDGGRAAFVFADGTSVELDPVTTSAFPEGSVVQPLLRPREPQPVWLRRQDEQAWLTTLDRGRAVYLGFHQTHSVPQGMLDRLRKLARTNKVRRVVVDARLNGGGDNTTYWPLVDAMRAAGRKAVLLVGRKTFSAAGNFAAVVDAQTRARVLGEPSGGAPNQWGDSAPVDVPSLGLTVHVAVEDVQAVPADRRLAVMPDVPVALTAADFFAGRDPVLARALR